MPVSDQASSLRHKLRLSYEEKILAEARLEKEVQIKNHKNHKTKKNPMGKKLNTEEITKNHITYNCATV